jgi:hypothetical protein
MSGGDAQEIASRNNMGQCQWLSELEKIAERCTDNSYHDLESMVQFFPDLVIRDHVRYLMFNPISIMMRMISKSNPSG